MILSNLNLFIFNFLFFCFLINFCVSSDSCFRAAVYEHIRIDEPIDDLFEVLKNNFDVYEKVTKRASFENTKIIVFPENGLVFSHNKSKVLNEGVISYIPKLNTNPCDIYTKKLKEITSNHHSDIYVNEKLEKLNQQTFNENDFVKVNSELIRKFSCLASENKIHIAVNLIEVDKQTKLSKEVNLEDSNKSKNELIYQLEKFNDQPISTKFNDPLDTLKLNDQIINDKLSDQLLKLNENQKSDLDKYSLYNTDVVFNSEGEIIAKYRKYHLFGDNIFNKTEKPEFIYFDTNYGRFGIIICADILFEQPLKNLVEEKKIDHLIFSTNWFDELPLLTGLGFHSAVAAKYQINILSSNLRNFKNGTFGSGIYNGKTGVTIQTTFDNHNRLLIADLPIEKNQEDKKTLINFEDKSSIDTYKYSNLDSIDYTCNHFESLRVAEETYQRFSYFFKQNTFLDDYVSLQNSLDKFKYKRIETTEGKIQNVCDGNVCCELEWKMNDKFNFASDNYYLVALNRLRSSYVPWYEESCALVSYYQFKPECKLVSSTHFDKLVLRGKFNTTQVYPNVLSSALVLVPKKKWSFKKNINEFELSFDDVKRTINSVFLYGINYDKTPKKN